LSHYFFCGDDIPRTCSRIRARCTSIAHGWLQRTLRGNIARSQGCALLLACLWFCGASPLPLAMDLELHTAVHMLARSPFARPLERKASQCSIHNTNNHSLFLLKVAVEGEHQCAFINFCGVSDPDATTNSNTLLPGNIVPSERATFDRSSNVIT
jgi:hypothetical protein